MNLFDTLELADKHATLAINSINCPASDFIWQIFSDKVIWCPLYLAALVFLFVRLGWKKALAAFVACVLTFIICDQGGNICKYAFMRLRPSWDGFMVQHGLHLLEGKGNLFGFYSAHAANAMGFAISSLCCFRKDTRLRYRGYAWPIIIWAFLVGFSRIFVGKHFLGDVLVGFMVGAVVGWFFAWLGGLAMRKLSL